MPGSFAEYNTSRHVRLVAIGGQRHSGYGGVEGGESHDVDGQPAPAELLCTFANTLDVDVDADPPEALPDAAALTDWLAGAT